MSIFKRLRRTPAEASERRLPRDIPASMIAEAKANPNGWVYEIEGDFGPDDAVPPEAIRGAWKVGPTGELTGKYEANPNFRRSSRVK